MKKIALQQLLLVTITASAQTYQDIKNSCLLQQISKAKTDIYKAIQDAAFTSKAEAYILKAAIYSTLYYDTLKSNPAQAETLAANADEAFITYKEKDAALQLAGDEFYQTGPSNLYMVYY